MKRLLVVAAGLGLALAIAIIAYEGFGAVTQSLTRLMGKGEAAARRELMELHGDAVEVDV